jgi:hypothetical protein
LVLVVFTGGGACDNDTGGGGVGQGKGGTTSAKVKPTGGDNIPVDELIAAANWTALVAELEPVVDDPGQVRETRDDATAAYLLGLAKLAQQGDESSLAKLTELDAGGVLARLSVSEAFVVIREQAVEQVEVALSAR